jgi:hypothetical protein
VPYNFGDWHGIEQFGGYAASIPENVQDVQGGQDAPRLFGVRYWVGREPSHAGQTQVFVSRSGLKVYADPHGAEPMWIVHPEQCAGADRFRVLQRLPGTVSFEVEAACPGLLVVGDPKFPGWRGWVDGRRTVIQEAERVLRALPLRAGTHRVDFRYRPPSVLIGGGMTAMGFLLTVISALYPCVRAPAHSKVITDVAPLPPHG